MAAASGFAACCCSQRTVQQEERATRLVSLPLSSSSTRIRWSMTTCHAWTTTITRRGRPTAHRVFGVHATTVAGAAMIPLAARIAYDSAVALVLPSETGCTIVKVLMRAAGAGGMIGGQLADLDAEGADLSREELDLIHSAKTGALIAASLEMGGLAAGATQSKVRALADFGLRIGLAFQIMDDILDVTSSTDMLGKTTGRDAALRKSTYPALLGVEGATTQDLRPRNVCV